MAEDYYTISNEELMNLTDENRQEYVEKFVEEIRSYLSEGQGGDGDGYAPRTWEDIYRFSGLVTALRDLRWARDADFHSGIGIELYPKALVEGYTVTVPHTKHSDFSEIYSVESTDVEKETVALEHINEMLRSSSLLMSYGKSLADRAANLQSGLLRERTEMRKLRTRADEFIALISETPVSDFKKIHDMYTVEGFNKFGSEFAVRFAKAFEEHFKSNWVEQRRALHQTLIEYRSAIDTNMDASRKAEVQAQLLALIAEFGYIPFLRQIEMFNQANAQQRGKYLNSINVLSPTARRKFLYTQIYRNEIYDPDVNYP